MNRTIKETATALLADMNVSLSFWPYAVQASVYNRNRFPSSTINFKIPVEMIFGHKPEYEQMQIFGSKVFVNRTQDLKKPVKLPYSSVTRTTNQVTFFISQKSEKSSKAATPSLLTSHIQPNHLLINSNILAFFPLRPIRSIFNKIQQFATNRHKLFWCWTVFRRRTEWKCSNYWNNFNRNYCYTNWAIYTRKPADFRWSTNSTKKSNDITRKPTVFKPAR